MDNLAWKDAGAWKVGDKCVVVYNHIGVKNNPPKDMILIVKSVDRAYCEASNYSTLALTFSNWAGPSTGCVYWNALAFRKLALPPIVDSILSATPKQAGAKFDKRIVPRSKQEAKP